MSRYTEDPEFRARQIEHQRKYDQRTGYAAQRAWRERNPEKWRHISRRNAARHRALDKERRRSLEGNHTLQEWADVKSACGNACAYCGRAMERLTKDHVVAVTRGGTDYASNILPACRRCNSSKGNKGLLSWLLGPNPVFS